MGIRSPVELDARTRSAVLGLAAEVERRDGAPPFSDQALTRLASTAVTHVVALDGKTLTGYAQRDGTSVELAALDDATLDELLSATETAGDAPVQVWSHGQHSPTAAVARERGYRPARTLLQLRRLLQPVPPLAPLADGVRMRTFVPGADEDAWLAVNAAAFASHPEQGRWTHADLLAREAEPWFDPAGFLLAERGDVLLGFHWTKVHADGMGEVYVLGIDPAAHGLGLGSALLTRGLASLADRGCTEVLLYADGDNTVALRLYDKFGFHHHDIDVQWLAERPAD
jgi:mycothiol synthase